MLSRIEDNFKKQHDMSTIETTIALRNTQPIE